MRKIKDRILLGSIIGALVSVPLQICDVWLDMRGITDVNYGPNAAKIFLKKKKAKSLGGRIIAAAINTVNTGLVGTVITYTLSLTGKDNATVKGAGVGALMWIGLAGLFTNKVLNIKSKQPMSPLISLGFHLLFGAGCGYMISKLGDDSLFPNSSIRNQQKVPIVYTGTLNKAQKKSNISSPTEAI